MKYAKCLLLVFPHRWFLEFSKNSKNSALLPFGVKSRNTLSEFEWTSNKVGLQLSEGENCWTIVSIVEHYSRAGTIVNIIWQLEDLIHSCKDRYIHSSLVIRDFIYIFFYDFYLCVFFTGKWLIKQLRNWIISSDA